MESYIFEETFQGEVLGEVLQVKIGKVQSIRFGDDKEFTETAIKKTPVEKAYITKLGPEGNEVGLKEHHGGVNKALFSVSTSTFSELNKITDSNFKWDETAVYGENLVISQLDENSICVGDVYEIGECTVEISQPRKPCIRLSKNTGCPEMLETIIKTGWTGWYSRIIKEGIIKKGDKMILRKRVYPELTIKALNELLINHKDKEELLKKAVEAKELAPAFKKYLEAKLI